MSIDDLEKNRKRQRSAVPVSKEVFTGESSGKQATHSKQFNMRMTPEVYTKLQDEARRRNLKASTLVSLLISWYTSLPEKQKAAIALQGAFEQPEQ